MPSLNSTQRVIIIYSMLVILISGCEKECPTELTEEGLNLITNSSFEINGNKSIDGWTLHSNFLDVGFSNDVPPFGGNWSVVLYGGDRIVPMYLETKIAAPLGCNRYRLSIWAKFKDPQGYGKGYVNFNKNRSNGKYFTIQDSIWNYYELIDTLTTTNGDSLYVIISIMPFIYPSQIYYDLCQLELIQ